MNKSLTDLLERTRSWPQVARDELEHLALEIEAELAQGPYRATPEEIAGVDRGLRAATEGKFATDEEIKELFDKHRRA